MKKSLEKMEMDFSNREINAMFNEITGALSRIEAQVIKTNGRVSILELWKEGLMAKVSIITIFLGAIWALIVKKFL